MESESSPGAAEAAQRMLQMITGYWMTQIVHTVARFSIADELEGEPLTAAAVAARQSLDPVATFRLLRACASVGLVTARADGTFAATPLLATLRADVPGSLRSAAISQASPGFWLPWGQLPEAVRTGKPQASTTLGLEQWDYFARTPAEADAFTGSMTAMTALVAQEASRLVDTSSSRTAVDVGGAGGSLLQPLLQTNPELKGVVFDLPHVAKSVGPSLPALGFGNRLTAMGGDFFEGVPPADLYLLKWILHDWDDAACIRILQSCARSLRPGGRVIAIELNLGPLNEPGLAPLMDLNMLVTLTGRERSSEEYRHLFTQAGLHLRAVIPTHSPLSILEAVAA
jgi:hypothetical protein